MNPGPITGEICHAIDLLPTLADAAGVKLPTTPTSGTGARAHKGSSLFPVLANRPTDHKAHVAIFWAHAKGAAVRKGDFKLVKLKGKDWELYDVKKDGTELNDLASSMPERVAELETLFVSWAKSNLPNSKKRKKKSPN